MVECANHREINRNDQEIHTVRFKVSVGGKTIAVGGYLRGNFQPFELADYPEDCTVDRTAAKLAADDQEQIEVIAPCKKCLRQVCLKLATRQA